MAMKNKRRGFQIYFRCLVLRQAEHRGWPKFYKVFYLLFLLLRQFKGMKFAEERIFVTMELQDESGGYGSVGWS
jgi:hypothetical protein